MRAEEHAPKIGMIFTASDSEVARSVLAGLAELGVPIAEIRDGDDDALDAAIVLVSFDAVFDGLWQQRVATIATDRIVPVQLSAMADFPMPSSIADRSWVRYFQLEPTAARAAILAGLRTDEALYKSRRRLETEAAVWQQLGRDSDLLMTERSRAEEAAALGEDLEAVGQAISETARAFVDASLPHARRRRRNRRLIAGSVVFTVALAISGGLVLLPGVFQARTTQEAGFITTPDPTFVADNPSWAAMLAGELVIHPASEAQRLIARGILRSTLSRRWSMGVVASIDHQVVEAIPSIDGASVVTLLRRPSGVSVIASFDLPSGEWTWSAVLGDGYSFIDMPQSEGRVVVGGAGGIQIVELASHRVTALFDEAVDDVVDAGSIVYAVLPSGDVVTVDVADGTQEAIGRFGTPLDVATTSSGVRGVFSDGSGGISVVALDDGGRLVAQGAVVRPVLEAAVLSEDGRSAYVASGDHQLWWIDKSGSAPLGIAVPDRIGLLQRINGGRLAVGGAAEPLRVFDAVSGYELGEACSDVRGPTSVGVSADGATMVCTDGLTASAWPTPLGPAADLAVSGRSEPFENNPIVDVESDAASVRFFFHTTGDLGRYTDWIPLGRGSVSAVALAPDVSRVLIGTDAGEVFIYAIGATEASRVVDWQTPDRSPVQSVGWNPEPAVFATAGTVWRTPDCTTCGTDDGLLAVLTERLPRCWSEVQLSLLSSEARRRFGVEPCVPKAEGP